MDDLILMQSYFITGNTGTGKTYWAKEKYHEARNYWDKVRDFQSLSTTEAIRFHSYRELKGGYENHRNRDEIVAMLKRAKFLVLDDFFGTSRDGFSDLALIILDSRIENKRATVITSNMDLSEMGEIDDRVASRLSTFQKVIFKGEDRRINKTKPIIVDNSI